MIKGFIYYNDQKIPFVLDNYRLDLFTDDEILLDFIKKHNFKHHYILKGQCFRFGTMPQDITLLIEHSMGSTCYVCCYIIKILDKEDEYNTIGLQSPFLDDVFKYKYNYIDIVRSGTNLAIEPKEIYQIPFLMNQQQYQLSFRIGHNNRLGLLEDLDKKGEVIIPIKTNDIQECFDIAQILYRLAMFMTSHSEVPFKRITLYKNDLKVGWFYLPLVSENAVSGYDGLFHEFDVMKYVPKILNNIAMDTGNKITQSIPLGHLGNLDSMFSPQRFIEQITAFEYLFAKLESKKSKDKSFPLKKELQYMFDAFPKILSNTKLSSEEISNELKTIRVNIVHGYSYYYDFKNEPDIKYKIILLDKLILNMSLRLIGFSDSDIETYPSM